MDARVRAGCWVGGAGLASALLFFLGTGLHPAAWAVWVAPLPVLLVVGRVRAWVAFAVAAAAWSAGESAMWGYFIGTVQIPPGVAVGMLVGSALLFGVAVLPTRALMRQQRPLLAAAVFPAAWATVEFAMAHAAPFGAWWSLAYTQADVLPVLQVVSVTGVWGVSFLVLWVPAAIAAVSAPGLRGRRIRAAITAAAVLVVAVGYGAWRLGETRTAPTQRVALMASDLAVDPIPLDTDQGRAALAAYTTGIEALSGKGMRVVVLPEKVFAADDASLPELTAPLAQLARTLHADIVVGLVLEHGAASYNAAVDVPADGSPPVTYFKQHLVTGVEDDLTAGDTPGFVAGQAKRWALAVCFDLDFPDLVRDYRQRGAGVLFVPGWDFSTDAWLHSRMAVTRGVENGMAIVRSARQGALTVSDPNGRVLVDGRTSGTSMVTVSAGLPTPGGPTLYSRFGDWFAWICVLMFLGGTSVAYLGRRRAQTAA